MASYTGDAVLCHTLSTDFRAATAVQRITLRASDLQPHQILVYNHFVGINASDVNMTAGRYYKSAPRLPMKCGFEAVGEVVAAGADAAETFPVGTPVAVASFGAFAEYQVVPAMTLLPLPKVSVQYLPLIVSGVTASVALERVAEIKSSETVLVTAAAGGTGQFAVQLAKAAGCRVLGTCSSADKVARLRELGCDRPIDTSTEDLDAVLRSECPDGVDVVYESVGGSTFDTCAAHLAVKGRLVVIGFISQYKDGSGFTSQPGPAAGQTVQALLPPLQAQLLSKSASVRGFFLPHFAEDIPIHFARLVEMVDGGKLSPGLDLLCLSGRFHGCTAIADAVDYLYSRKSVGKVFASLRAAAPRGHARL